MTMTLAPETKRVCCEDAECCGMSGTVQDRQPFDCNECGRRLIADFGTACGSRLPTEKEWKAMP